MATSTEICILAGGLSSRMGRNKALLKIAGQSMLRRIAENVRLSGFPVRIIRHDLVQRCGPLGGIYTALRTSSADNLFFLSCDMPFVTVDLLRHLQESLVSGRRAAFMARDALAGFPLMLRQGVLPEVEAMMTRKEFSIQKLARNLDGALVHIESASAWRLLNANTPEQWRQAQILFGR